MVVTQFGMNIIIVDHTVAAGKATKSGVDQTMRNVAAKIAQEARESIRKGHPAEGSEWQPLHQKWSAWKRASGYDAKTLNFTKALMTAIDHKRVADGRYIVFVKSVVRPNPLKKPYKTADGMKIPSRIPSQVNVQTYAASMELGALVKVTPAMRGFLAAVLGINLKSSTSVIRIPKRSFLGPAATKVTKDHSSIAGDMRARIRDQFGKFVGAGQFIRSVQLAGVAR